MSQDMAQGNQMNIRNNALSAGLVAGGALLGSALTLAPAQAQSLLSTLIDQCARGNMMACSQGRQLSAQQAQQRAARNTFSPPSASQIERRNHWANEMNRGGAAAGQVYNDVYKHQLSRGY
jgi:hypothetical protein